MRRPPLAHDPSLALAAARTAAAARKLADDTLARLERALSRGGLPEAFASAEGVLSGHALALADLLAEADVAGWLLGAEGVSARLPPVPPAHPSGGETPSPRLGALRDALSRLPEELREPFLAALPPDDRAALQALRGGPPDVPARELMGMPAPDGVRLPLVERAAESLAEKRLVSYQEMRQLAGRAKEKALAVAGLQKQEATGKLHEILSDSVREGGTLRDFRRRVTEELPEDTFVSAAAQETTFRDATMHAYSEGMDRILADPVVGGLFPYEETLPIRDSRLSSMCERAARSGIQGTAIFRRDDPVWQRIKPPRHPRCRCGRNALTVEDAAEAGVQEAKRWLRTGTPPVIPSFVVMPQELILAGL